MFIDITQISRHRRFSRSRPGSLLVLTVLIFLCLFVSLQAALCYSMHITTLFLHIVTNSPDTVSNKSCCFTGSSMVRWLSLVPGIYSSVSFLFSFHLLDFIYYSWHDFVDPMFSFTTGTLLSLWNLRQAQSCTSFLIKHDSLPFRHIPL